MSGFANPSPLSGGWHEDEACDKDAFTRMVREQAEKQRMMQMQDARPGGLDGGKIAKQSPIDAAHARAMERAENLHKLAVRLREQLMPVLAPRLESATGAMPTPEAPRAIGASSMVSMFEAIAEAEGAAANVLGDILSRLEL